MRLTKLVTVALATAALAVSGASADPGHGKGKDTSPAAPKCKPANVQLKGLMTSAPGVHGNQATMADLAMGDSVKVKAKVCRADLASGATPALTARKVDAHAPK